MTGTGEMLLPVVGSIDNDEIIRLRKENESLKEKIATLEAMHGKDDKTLEIAMKLYQAHGEAFNAYYKQKKGE